MEGLTELKVPAPPMLAPALGYSGDARYVAIYWDAEAGGARWDDGSNDEDAEDDAWSEFTSHVTIEPALRDYCIGDPGPARHFLLLDRAAYGNAGALHIGPIGRLSETMRPGGVARTETVAPVPFEHSGIGALTRILQMTQWLDEEVELRRLREK